jgi:triacylglycerol lipase
VTADGAALAGYTGPVKSKKSRIAFLALAALAFFHAAAAEGSAVPAPPAKPLLNSRPIILVHGILAYGQDQHLPISAWGGFGDYRQLLADEGWKIYSATMGPFSSNWDRACELFAYIKGGRTDYGAVHSARYGHARYGRVYPGVHPAWNEENKVDLLCHSMGGQTARMLVQLLEAGAPEELATAPDGASPLFEGGHSWVLGLISICTPHDGSTLSLAGGYENPVMRRALVAALAAASPLYDPRLDHWGLERREGEGIAEYAARLEAHDTWYMGEDSCYADLRPAGAAKINGWVRAMPDVYYFSWGAWDTVEFESRLVPSPAMHPMLLAGGIAIGRFVGWDGKWALGPDWRDNDGVVNLISMNGPKLNSTDRIRPFSGTPEKGAWNYMGALPRTDHLDLLGFSSTIRYSPQGFASVEDWYRYNLRLLASLKN